MAVGAFLLLAVAQLATAHFGLEYPAWRDATLGSGHNYSQWAYPCAGVPGNIPGGNRTDWPLTGGSVILDLHHDWTYVFINLGLGANVTVFNYTLTPEFLNATGEGKLCLPTVPLPADLKVEDGTQASIQVITVGDSGAGLYNCADITFKADAKPLQGDACRTVGVTTAAIKEQKAGTSAGAIAGMNSVVLSSVVGLALLFVCGMSL
ncbi:hypothetical protein B0T14DRAFT_532151 [Immersiella caudata]|uniref:Copper acquisition factor BIM1-like domain-containing protein n=1 Tax=Immersiella caudata TaxID=314043 RepID=A0AA39XDF1_9PEZI|nr:hypothetical protein B0T14DRAFT_532151 [Immersiella caudata]